ncbi:hypothetical protein K431DRAFT_284412 [Polychaeton citri CBS 116435]|uniref:Uncharacterized protein n=1 Tax=Polychaeton citri CBS 116435 TaxID=1314669 RepID=A0A9P4Q9B2_9PEZI|nr:hypothetical protein K431DRAFT_284412 [Polychaeton citri CBS 116435]
MADWEDTVLTTRRIPHGRSKRGKHGSSNPSSTSSPSSPFDPRKALGLYTLTGPAVDRLLPDSSSGAQAEFEIHELTPTPGGMVASMTFGARLTAAVLIAGSRRKLAEVVGEAEAGSESESESGASSAEGEGAGDDGDEEDDPSALLHPQDRKDQATNALVAAFAKNSFRNPKFWLQWQGQLVQSPSSPPTVTRGNAGYVVFSTNACRDFAGTLSCRDLGWENVAVRGRKVTGKATRGGVVRWADFGDGSDGEEEEEVATGGEVDMGSVERLKIDEWQRASNDL